MLKDYLFNRHGNKETTTVAAFALRLTDKQSKTPHVGINSRTETETHSSEFP